MSTGVDPEPQGRRSRDVFKLAGLVLAAWSLACLTTIAFFWLFSPGRSDGWLASTVHDLFGTPNALAPLVTFIAACIVNATVHMDRALSSDPVVPVSHDVAFVRALVLAILSTACVAVLGLWAGLYGFHYQLLWACLSGYTIFIFIGGCITWWPRAVR